LPSTATTLGGLVDVTASAGRQQRLWELQLVLSINGKNTVKDDLSQEKIVGSDDMTPDAIAAEAQQAGLSGVAGVPPPGGCGSDPAFGLTIRSPHVP
jgi:hypothetical protein